MTKDQLIKEIKNIAYNNKAMTKRELIFQLEQILRGTGESVLNEYEYSTPADEKRIEAMDGQIMIEAKTEVEFENRGDTAEYPVSACEGCHAIGKPDMKAICEQCPYQFNS